MIRTFIISRGVPSQGLRRLIVLPTDIFVEAKCKDEKGYEVTISAAHDDNLNITVSLSISEEDYNTLANDDPMDYTCGSYEHDLMAQYIASDIARFFAEEYDEDPEKGDIIFYVDHYIDQWESNIEYLAEKRRKRWQSYFPASTKEAEEDIDESE